MSKISIQKITRLLSETPFDDMPAILSSYENDEREGVKKLIAKHKRWYNKVYDDRKRLEIMLHFEHKYASYAHICGVDEAGAGPLAGPVSAAAVILPKDFVIERLNDSKKITELMRNRLYEKILQNAVSHAVAFIENDEIDNINILQARLKAMKLAVEQLSVPPDFVMVDGNAAIKFNTPQITIVNGDSRSVSIAAASILAKVERDKLMNNYHKIYPQYGFDRNKGYGTAEHLAAIEKFGLTPIHRKTFLNKG